MIYCVDANILIWRLKRNASEGQEDMIKRADHLFEWFDKNNHNVLVPTVVLAEILAPEPLEKYPVFMEMFTKNFMIAPFDTMAATRYAHLFTHKIESIKAKSDENGISHQKMKIDHLIVACALAHGASAIYSTDNGLKTFGHRHIEVKELPPLPPPANTLFPDDPF